MSAEGAVLFARYAYPPNELGYCGPDGAQALLRPEAAEEITRRARHFDGAWTYLEALAAAAGTPDPLDRAVVEAYWVGSDLLERVDPGELLARLARSFRGQLGGTWREAGTRARAHHSFHVFEVYPWAALLAGPAADTATQVLDRCRIRTGEVIAVEGEEAVVATTPLRWDGVGLVPGPVREERARWSVDGMTLLEAVAPGDTVALHWDWVCDVLTPDQAARLERLDGAQRAALP